MSVSPSKQPRSAYSKCMSWLSAGVYEAVTGSELSSPLTSMPSPVADMRTSPLARAVRRKGLRLSPEG